MESRVALIASTYSMSSGASWSLLRLAVRLKKAGVKIIVILPKRGDIEEKLKQEQIKYYIVRQCNGNIWFLWDNANPRKISFVIRYGIKKGINQIAKYKMERVLKEEKINIVHMNALTCYVAADVAVKRNISFVWHIREFMEEDLGVEFFDKAKSYDLIRKSARIIAVSEAVRDKYRKFFQNIEVVYNGIEVESFFKNRKILQDKTVTIALVGRVVEGKGQYELVKAVNRLPLEIKTNLCCNLVGGIKSKPYFDKIVEFIEKNRLEGIVHILGYTDNMDVYLSGVDILCSCSKCEAFGRSVVEGMVAGCLVIGTNTGATKEIISHGKNGLIYEYGNEDSLKECIEYAVTHRDLACQMASRGQKEAKEKYTDEANARKIMKIYREVLENEKS